MIKMKDEEMAEEIANKKLCATIMCYNHCDFNSPEPHKCGDWYRCYECALAGLKAGRPQWHKVADGDLPKNTISVLVNRGGNRTDRARYSLGKWYGYYDDDEMEGVIAWCEIPTFDKE